MTVLTAPSQTIAKAGKLINLILRRLVPMLLDATDGDPHAARALALETVNDYAARNNADLLAIAQIIACGLASLGNLSLSMTGDIPHALLLRLQAAANALERTAQQNRRILRQAPPPQTDFSYEPTPEDAALEAAALAALAESRQQVAQARAKHARAEHTNAGQPPEPVATQAAEPENPERAPAEPAAPPENTTPTPATPAPVVPAASKPPAAPAMVAPKPTPQTQGATIPDLTKQEKAIIWAGGMNRISAEYTASIPHLPPAQRRGASLRAEALSSTAIALIASTQPDTVPQIRRKTS